MTVTQSCTLAPRLFLWGVQQWKPVTVLATWGEQTSSPFTTLMMFTNKSLSESRRTQNLFCTSELLPGGSELLLTAGMEPQLPRLGIGSCWGELHRGFARLLLLLEVNKRLENLIRDDQGSRGEEERTQQHELYTIIHIGSEIGFQLKLFNCLYISLRMF